MIATKLILAAALTWIEVRGLAMLIHLVRVRVKVARNRISVHSLQD